MEVSGKRLERSFKDTMDISLVDTKAFCQPCSSDRDLEVAIGYCQNCNEYFCAACLKVHRKQTLSRNHMIVEGGKMPQAESSDTVSVLCVRHTNEIEKFYCSSHDVVGCSDCMVLDHKACKVHSIQDISRIYFNGPEHKELQKKVDQFLKNLELLKREIQTNEKEMQQTFSEAVDDIKKFRKEINAHLDHAEAELMSEVHKRMQEDENLMSKLKEDGQAISDYLQEVNEKLHVQLNQANELFMTAKQVKEKMANIEDTIIQMLQNCNIKFNEFKPSPEIKGLVSAKLLLGELLQKKTVADMEPKFDDEIEIRAPEDSDDCRIFASALISPTQLILTDARNKCVKIVDIKNRKLSGRYEFTSQPYGLSVISQKLIAVTLPKEKKIQLLMLAQGDTLTKSKTITVNGTCEDIVYQNESFVLRMQDHIEIINMSGQVTKTIFPSNRNELMSIALAQDYRTFYVSNKAFFSTGPTVYKLDFEGNLNATYKAGYFSQISGLSVTKDGSVFACNWSGSGSIYILSPECKQIKEILKHCEHVISPWCVSFCNKTNKLFLCNNEQKLAPKLRNVLKIFQLK